MSRLTDLDIGASAVIKDIEDEKFRDRLRAFGITKNSQIKLKGYGFLKKVVKIEADNTCIALRKEEADKVLVEKR
ncbi:MAG: ferrous iron transport protein A [Epsilonproteobacteria bacterium]|nr:ferrous iron transport protein A [Campylobacterota bacterium]